MTSSELDLRSLFLPQLNPRFCSHAYQRIYNGLVRLETTQGHVYHRSSEDVEQEECKHFPSALTLFHGKPAQALAIVEYRACPHNRREVNGW